MDGFVEVVEGFFEMEEDFFEAAEDSFEAAEDFFEVAEYSFDAVDLFNVVAGLICPASRDSSKGVVNPLKQIRAIELSESKMLPLPRRWTLA